MRRVLLAGILFLASVSQAQLWSGVLASSRATNWTDAGVVGGIPSESWTRCTTGTGTSVLPSSSTAAQINTAISGCDANHYVELGTGTFSLSTSLVWNSKSNIVARGQGADQTFLVFSNEASCQGTFAVVCFISSDTNYQGGPSNTANWTAGYAAGATTISISSVTSLVVGDPIMLDQTDDISDDTSIFVCYTRGAINCSINGDSGGGPRTGRSQQQMVSVASCDGNSTPGHACIGGSNITITPALVMPNWVSGKSPQAWWASNPEFMSGLENLSIDVGTSNAILGVVFFNCMNCWVRGIRTIGPFQRSPVQVFQSNHITVQDNYFYKTPDSASVNYGVEEIPCSGCLIQNNIFQQVQAPYPANGSCTGCVFAYNFDVNNVFTGGTFQNQSGFPHAVGDDHLLYEGNIGSGIYSDNFHGSHHFQTIFRNYWNGYQKNEGTFTTSATTPIIMATFSRFYNIIGNVLGNCARQTVYESAVGNVNAGSVIYEIGFGHSGAPVTPDDSNTVTTLMRWGNYDCVTNTNRFVNGEVPSGLSGAQAPFANPVPSNQVIPSSFYLSTRPAWWTSGKPWPSVGPDISGGNVKYCVGGAQTGTYVLTAGQCPGGTATTLAGGRITSNPAMDCYLNTMGGVPDGTGSVLTFNADTCYAVVAQSPSVNVQGQIKMSGTVILK